jgi:hypothetical protein
MPDVKKHAPGLKCRNVLLASGSEGANYYRTKFLLLNPDFFFDASGLAQKAVPVPFFGVFFMAFFFISKLFLNLRGISVGARSPKF